MSTHDPRSGDRRTAGALAAAAIVLVAGIVFLAQIPGPSRPLSRDFAQYLIAAGAIRRGEPEAFYFTDLYTGITTDRFPDSRFARIGDDMGIHDTSYYIYPPWVGALYVPLTFLTPYRALLAAYVLGWVLTALGLAVVARRLPGWGWPAAGLVLLLLIHSHPFEHAIGSGQASIPIYVLFALFGAAMWRRRDAEAGVWWALLTGIKLFPLLFLPYAIVLRRWKLLVAYAVAGAALLAFSIVVTDWDAHVRFLGIIRDYAHYSTTRSTNQSLTGFLMRLVDPTSPRAWSVLPIPAWIAWANRIWVLGTLAGVLALVARARRSEDPWTERIAFSLMSLWVLGASANVWSHHLVALALPMQVAAACLVAGERPARRLAVAAWIAAWAGVLGYAGYLRLGSGFFDRPPGVLLVSTPFYGTLILFALLAWLLWRRGRPVAV